MLIVHSGWLEPEEVAILARRRPSLVCAPSSSLHNGYGNFVVGKLPQRADVGAEHGVEHPRREQVLDRVPGEVEAAVLLVNLVVEPDLWRLADGVDDLAEVLSLEAFELFQFRHALREPAGEYDGHCRVNAALAPPRHLPDHLYPADVAVVHVAPELRLQRVRPRRERVGRRAVHGEQRN